MLGHSPTRRRLAAFVAAATLVAACAERAPEVVRDPNAPLYVADRGLSTPESVLWDAARGIWWVSNINGAPTAKDDNGYILRLTPNGAAMDSLPFISGSDDDITLHAPKGMALVGDTLWVADIDALRGFDVVSGTSVATIEMARLGATFLNDVAAGPDGALYITDSGIAFDADGNVTHPGRSRIYVVRGRTARAAVDLPRESAANGIAWDAARGAWLVVAFNAPGVFAWAPGEPRVQEIGQGPGGGDGLIILADGRALFSSWADSSLTLFENGAATTLRKGLPAPADLGYDRERGIVAVPLFLDNRVEFWEVP